MDLELALYLAGRAAVYEIDACAARARGDRSYAETLARLANVYRDGAVRALHGPYATIALLKTG